MNEHEQIQNRSSVRVSSCHLSGSSVPIRTRGASIDMKKRLLTSTHGRAVAGTLGEALRVRQGFDGAQGLRIAFEKDAIARVA
jgi:hypothetical protein